MGTQRSLATPASLLKGEAECLVIGATGLIGRHVANVLEAAGISWRGASHRRVEPGLFLCDLTKPEDIWRTMVQLCPRGVFHCANFPGGVDDCQARPADAAAFHLHATQELGRACRHVGAALMFLSTDYVFRGDKSAYGEDDPVDPPNVYGRLKSEAERWIGHELPRHLIVRTTNVYGWDPQTPTPNYFMQAYRNLSAGQRFRAASYLWGTPTYAGDLARALVELYQRQSWGLFHVVGPDFVNRLTWAREVAQMFSLDASLIDELARPPATAAPRPGPSRLRTEKFSQHAAMRLRSLREGLELIQRESRTTAMPPWTPNPSLSLR